MSNDDKIRTRFAPSPTGYLHVGGARIHLDEFLGRKIDIDFMFFTTDFILGCLKDNGFEKIEIIERDPYPGVEYQSRRAYVMATKPLDQI